MTQKQLIDELGTCLMLLLDNVDYVTYPDILTQMIGANIPKEIIVRANKAKQVYLNESRIASRN